MSRAYEIHGLTGLDRELPCGSRSSQEVQVRDAGFGIILDLSARNYGALLTAVDARHLAAILWAAADRLDPPDRRDGQQSPTEEGGGADRGAASPDITASVGECASARVADAPDECGVYVATSSLGANLARWRNETLPASAPPGGDTPAATAGATTGVVTEGAPAVLPANKTRVLDAPLGGDTVSAPAGAAPTPPAPAGPTNSKGRPGSAGGSKATTDPEVFTVAREAVLREKWPAGVLIDDIKAACDVLPGAPIHRDLFGVWASRLELRRPPGFAAQVSRDRAAAGKAMTAEQKPAPVSIPAVHGAPQQPVVAATAGAALAAPAVPRPAHASFLVNWAVARGLNVRLPLGAEGMEIINAKAQALGLPPFELAGRD